jgi:SPP1 gp7 family putative phage head morphogenesis protein
MAKKISKKVPPQPPRVNRLPKTVAPTKASTAAQVSPNATDRAPYRQPADPGIETTAAPLLKQELGISQESAISNRYELLQYNPDELFTKKGIRILEKMSTTDDVIVMGLTSLKMMALSGGYRIDAASDDPMDQQIADEVADNFEALQGGLRQKLFSVMGALDIGASIHEKIWDEWEEGHPLQGHTRLRTLKSKNPQWFNIAVDDFGNPTGIVMISPPAYGRKLPARKFLVYSGQKRYENVWGTARTRALYDWWYLKGLAKAALAVLLKKYGKETPIGFVPPTMSPADKASFLNALSNLAQVAAATMPEGTRIEWMKFDAQSIEGCLKIIEKADQQMTKILMGQVSSSGTSSQQSHSGGGGGNKSGGSSKGGSQEHTLEMYLEYITSDVAENPFAELIKEIVDYNYAGVTKYPKFVFRPITEDDRTAAVQTFITAATAQVGGTPDVAGPNGKVKPGKPGKGLVTPGPDDEEYIREVLGFPSLSSKNTLRPNRNRSKPVERVIPPLPPIDPRLYPTAGFRAPTPSAPGLPANYAEPDPMPTPHRELGKFEKSVDFAETWRIIDTEGEDEIVTAAAQVLRKAIDRLKVQAKRAMGNSSKIRKLDMPMRGELAAVLSDGLRQVAKKAMRQAAVEMAKKGKKPTVPDAAKMAEAHNLDGMTPEEVLQLIDDRSFTMAGKIDDEMLNDVKQSLYSGVKNGKSYKDIVYDIEDKVAKYVDLTQLDDNLAEHRLMNVVRTNVMSAYNDARQSIFEDPDMDGFVLAYQYSAVLDGETTPWCREMDGKIFKVTNPIWDIWTPPTFYQCRSVLVPITAVDDWDGEESEEPGEQPPAGFN